MAIEQLLATLEREGKEDAERVVADARAEAARLRAAAEEDLDRRRRDRVEPEGRRLRAEAAAALAVARHTARRAQLLARDRLLERIFAAARELLAAAAGSEAYRRTLGRRVEEAASYAGDSPAVLRCPPALAHTLAPVVASLLNLTVEPDAGAPPGFSITSADGAVSVDQTLTGRLAQLAPQLAIDLVARLQGGLELRSERTPAAPLESGLDAPWERTRSAPPESGPDASLVRDPATRREGDR